MESRPSTRFGRFVRHFEETNIALTMGLMTLITFANVIARYVFNDNILWALELTVFLFAWLVLVGASYGVKQQFHIGVDVIIERLPASTRKVCALISATICCGFAIALLVGSWNYWYPFITDRAWLETDDIPMPELFQFLADWVNEGERYEKIPRFIPYFALPLGTLLLTVRFLQASWRILHNRQDRLITSHEADEVKHLEDVKTENL